MKKISFIYFFSIFLTIIGFAILFSADAHASYSGPFLGNNSMTMSQDFPAGAFLRLCRNDGTNIAGVWQVSGSDQRTASFYADESKSFCETSPTPTNIFFSQYEGIPSGHAYIRLCVPDKKERWFWQIDDDSSYLFAYPNPNAPEPDESCGGALPAPLPGGPEASSTPAPAPPPPAQRTVLSPPPFILPDPGATLMQEYGCDPNDHNAQQCPTGPGGFHDGVDFDKPGCDDILVAAANGKVLAAKNDPSGGYGNFIIIWHEDLNLSTGYAHLSTFAVTKDDNVTKGDKIGNAGHTGNIVGSACGGEHLHFMTYTGKPTNLNNLFNPGSVINPLEYIARDNDEIPASASARLISNPRVVGSSAVHVSNNNSILDFHIDVKDSTGSHNIDNEEHWKDFAKSTWGITAIDNQCADTNCWDYLKRITNEKNINQALAFMWWWQTSGFAASINCGMSSDTKDQLDCITDKIVSANGSFEDFVAIFCGDQAGQSELCAHKPNDIAGIKWIYSQLKPNDLGPYERDCIAYCPASGQASLNLAGLDIGGLAAALNNIVHSLTSSFYPSTLAVASNNSNPWEFRIAEPIRFDTHLTDDNGYRDIQTIYFAVNNSEACGLYVRVNRVNDGEYNIALNEGSFTSPGTWTSGKYLRSGISGTRLGVGTLENGCAILDVDASYIDYIDDTNGRGAMALHTVVSFKSTYEPSNNQFLITEGVSSTGASSGNPSPYIPARITLLAAAAPGAGGDPPSDPVGGSNADNLCPNLPGGPYPMTHYDDTKGTVYGIDPAQKIIIKGGLVPCGRTCDDPTTTSIDESLMCTFCSGFTLFSNITNAVLFVWMPLIIVILITWGGVLIMVSGQNPSQRLRGKQIIQWALIGYAVMLFAWIIVNTFLSVIGIADWNGIGNWWNPNC